MKTRIFLLIFSVLLVLTSCVYYNTFYNARKYYSEALNAKEKNNGKLSPNIQTKFETSIGKCAYIIQEYPTNKWVDDAILLMGQCFYEQESYIKALRKFQEYEKYYNKYNLYPIAKLYLAKTYIAMKEFDEAMKQFSAIFNNSRFQEVRTEAYFDLVYYYIEKNKYNDAKNTILELLNTNLKRKPHLKAMFLYAEIVFLNGEYRSAELAFRNLLAEKPTKRYQLDALFYIGNIFLETGNYKEALPVFERLNETEVDYTRLPEIRMYIAICEAHLGNTEKAFKMFETLITDNKGKKIVSEINYYWGDIYFSVLNIDSLAIKKFNDVVVKNLDEELVRDTNNKLKIAQELISYQSVQSSNQISKIVEFQFQLAEYYNFDLNQPDSALAMYDDILERLPILRLELDSLNKIMMLYYPEQDTLATASDSLFISDSLEIEITVQNQDSVAAIIDTFAITQSVIDSILTTIPDSSFADSLRGLALIDTAFADTILTDSTMTDSTVAKPERIIVPAKQQLLVKIENLNNTIQEFEKEIIAEVLFMKLWTYREKLQDADKASEMLLLLETDYPTSKYTIAGKKLVNNEPYQLVDPEEHYAQLYLNKALDFYFDSVSLEQSHAYLDTILLNYDSTEVYPQALYLKSYLFVEESKDTTSARPYLEELFTDYPQHELTNEVSDFFDGTHFLTYEAEEDTTVIIDSTIVLPDSTIIPDSLFTIQDTTSIIDSVLITTEEDSISIFPEPEDSLEVRKQ
ncbi:MAG: tetratricopeptide repeat protein [Candidatus Celaenobacter antarcticus]|nr:tetratricopeptide repeat protein [Candidatus Celaenobacter antarcticus]